MTGGAHRGDRDAQRPGLGAGAPFGRDGPGPSGPGARIVFVLVNGGVFVSVGRFHLGLGVEVGRVGHTVVVRIVVLGAVIGAQCAGGDVGIGEGRFGQVFVGQVLFGQVFVGQDTAGFGRVAVRQADLAIVGQAGGMVGVGPFFALIDEGWKFTEIALQRGLFDLRFGGLFGIERRDIDRFDGDKVACLIEIAVTPAFRTPGGFPQGIGAGVPRVFPSVEILAVHRGPPWSSAAQCAGQTGFRQCAADFLPLTAAISGPMIRVATGIRRVPRMRPNTPSSAAVTTHSIAPWAVPAAAEASSAMWWIVA